MFVHKEDINYQELKTKNIDGKRHYVTPEGNYPSVTTVTSLAIKDGINAWRKRIGEKEANKIAGQAARRGTIVHKICEDYLNNVKINYEEITPINHFLFKQIKPILDIRLQEVYGLEVPLFSKYLRVAGRVDLVGMWDGKVSIIDFKTASKRKRRDWITNYFMQESAYAVMFEEMFGIPVSQIVTIIAVEADEPQLFIEKRDDWIGGFIELRDKWESSQSAEHLSE
jgi:genome maintenance exonuclease 1